MLGTPKSNGTGGPRARGAAAEGATIAASTDAQHSPAQFMVAPRPAPARHAGRFPPEDSTSGSAGHDRGRSPDRMPEPTLAIMERDAPHGRIGSRPNGIS